MSTDVTSSFRVPTEAGPVLAGAQGEIETQRQNMWKEAWADLLSRGWNAASVVNLHPFKLYTTGVLLRELTIPGVPREAEAWKNAPKIKLSNGVEVPYFRHRFTEPEVTVLERVIGPDTSAMASSQTQITLPWQFATDVLQQNNNPHTRGGVFCYEGDHEPFTHGKTADAERARFETAHAQQIMFYNSLLDQANSAHAEGNRTMIREISKYHRWAVMYLRLIGSLEKDPTWFHRDVTPGKAVSKACGCGAEVPASAVVCKECNHILEPYLAYKEGRFDENSPGGVLALRRCSKDQLKELGLYPEILPQDEHQKQRAKERKGA